jgi:hypothetical protein
MAPLRSSGTSVASRCCQEGPVPVKMRRHFFHPKLERSQGNDLVGGGSAEMMVYATSTKGNV